jgi:hypothetical protein
VAKLPELARCVRERGAELATAAVISLYRGGPSGWFAGEDASPAQSQWLLELARACDTGDYGGALHASDVFMQRAQSHAASLLERHNFLDRFGHASLQAMSQAGIAQPELAPGRRLFLALQQAHLDGRA